MLWRLLWWFWRTTTKWLDSIFLWTFQFLPILRNLMEFHLTKAETLLWWPNTIIIMMCILCFSYKVVWNCFLLTTLSIQEFGNWKIIGRCCFITWSKLLRVLWRRYIKKLNVNSLSNRTWLHVILLNISRNLLGNPTRTLNYESSIFSKANLAIFKLHCHL